MTGRRVITLEGAPHLTALMARAAVTSAGPAGRRRGGVLEDVEVRLADVRVERTRLAAYDRVCGFALRDTLPATYLHVLVFPLQVALMADRRFPLGLAGLVHLGNRIVAHRPVDAGETLSLSSSARGLRPHARGAQVDLVGQVRVGQELVWEGVSTYLARGASVAGEVEPAARLTVDLGPDPRPSAIWQLPADLGRRYAAVSGDVNPIHLSPLSARALGFPRALAHGMWTKAHALAAIEPHLPAAYAVDVAFLKPVLLPSAAAFLAARHDRGWDCAVRPAAGAGEHLLGTVRTL